MDSARITYFARTNARNQHAIFGIKQTDRLSHMYVIGKTGTGKSTLLERLVLSDIEAGEGLVLVDPHGDLVERGVASRGLSVAPKGPGGVSSHRRDR